MTVKGFKRNFRPLEILSDEEIDVIHRGTLDILENTGIRLDHERGMKLFAKNGCKVSYDDMRVRIPPGLVEECLRKAPSSFRLRGRDSSRDLIIGGDTLYFGTFPGMRFVDVKTWETRAAKKKENSDAMRLIDALENCHYFGPYSPYFEVEGVPPALAILESLVERIRNSTKPTEEGYHLDCGIFNIEIAQAVGMDIINMLYCAPPLTFRNEAIECAFRTAEAGLPLHIGGGILMGSTAPVTIAGALQSLNAQNMAAVVLTQLIKPGTRIIVGDFSFPQEMRNGAPAFGGIESSLHVAAFNQIWRRHGIPRANPSPGITSSKRIDFQAGYERSIAAVIAAISGANILALFGGVYGELEWHPIQAVLDDDVAGIIGRFIEGITVNHDTLATDLIEAVGPIPGMFLDKEHTRRWWQSEQFIPKSTDRLTYSEWMIQGKKSAMDYARERMEGILSSTKPIPLTTEQEKDIQKILRQARNFYNEKGML